ncbi:MerR family DNA-binding transcriptional regulator [Paenibacillus lutimineralis]|nr:MerR family DNA-binding transcriptional regulator [Paenibacillus lutimineralis]
MYTVHEVAKLAYTTVKTLHHYHKIGLLIPEQQRKPVIVYTEKKI